MNNEEKKSGYIFVYGTLKKGFSNYEYLLKNLTETITRSIFFGARLFDLGPFPAMVLTKGKDRVIGELMKVSDIDETLRKCDRLEGYNPEDLKGSFYHRIQIVVDETKAWTYVFNFTIPENAVVVEEWNKETRRQNNA